METLNQNWQNVSEIELIYKTKIKNSERPQIKSSKDAYKRIRPSKHIFRGVI